MCRYFGFKSCIIMTVSILLKPNVWGNLVLELNAKMLSADRKNFWRYKVDFLHGGTYQLKLQTDDVILHEWGQTCPRRVLGNNHVHSVATCFFFGGAYRNCKLMHN